MALPVDKSSSALSRQTAAMTTVPASPAASSSVSASSSSSACLLDLVEVISVDSSDEEDGPVVVPLQLVLKQEATDGIHVKYELRAVESDVVDLCSDNESDTGDGAAAGDKDKGSGEMTKATNGYVFKHARRRGVTRRALVALSTRSVGGPFATTSAVSKALF